MFPDYSGVTVPYNISPLNFAYSVSCGATSFSSGDYSFTIHGRILNIPENKWKVLMDKAKGGEVKVSNKRFGEWAFSVSEDPVDQYLTYRLVEPGYEIATRIEMRERDVTSFDERVISSYSYIDNSCMNCHFHSGRNSIFYLRGKRGGAILNKDGELRKLNLKDSSMYSGTVYGELHPGGRWGVFSTNIIIPAFHTEGLNRLEVYDTKSDIVFTDFDNNAIVLPESLNREDVFETFPCFNEDGTQVYYCAADTVSLPRDIRNLKYSLLRVPFDAATGTVGEPEIVWDASQRGGSVCHPKISPDGHWLVYTVSDYGTFPIWHRECDLEMMDLGTGKVMDFSRANSDFSETYHSWSSNSRWLVFASKRGDGQYGRPYYCHIDDEGNVSKPFLLPQKDPRYYLMTLKSFNIPDMGVVSAPFDAELIGKIRILKDAEVFTIKTENVNNPE